MARISKFIVVSLSLFVLYHIFLIQFFSHDTKELPKKPQCTFIFTFSTGHTGTRSLFSSFFNLTNGIVHHEREPPVFIEYSGRSKPVGGFYAAYHVLKPALQIGNFDRIRDYVIYSKIPQMTSEMWVTNQSIYFETGHVIILGLAPYLLEHSPCTVKMIRLRRNRIHVVNSFTYDKLHKNEDPCQYISSYSGIQLCPRYKNTLLKPSTKLWEEFHPVQRYFWMIDEVEAQWQFLKQKYTFQSLELNYELLDTLELEQIHQFTNLPIANRYTPKNFNSHRRDLTSTTFISPFISQLDVEYRELVPWTEFSY